jgi:hypothetical protein
MLRDGPAKGVRPCAATGARDAPDRWHQNAGFSVFFESRSGLPGELCSRTRLYHEESAEETVVVGTEPTAWVRWMLDRVRSEQLLSKPVPAAPATLLSLEVVEARIIPDPNGASDDSVSVVMQLRVTGLDELYRAVGARVVGVLFGPGLE